jgi:homoserine O-succinyltransferase
VIGRHRDIELTGPIGGPSPSFCRGAAGGREDGGPIVIGLVNNMPDPALKSTERQFFELLSAAAGGRAIRLRCFSLPGVPRGAAGQLYVRERHRDIRELWEERVDGLIVTGSEPRTPDLTDEPYWRALAELVDWAEENAASTIWSCLATHAAVLHRDGIARRPLGKKLVGVFDCARASDHPIMRGAAPRWQVPHSRHNEVPEDRLIERGYQVLSRSAEAGVDMFAAQRASLFLFFQGHLEYDRGALHREYRRDVGRFLAGERDDYPDPPRGYFDVGERAALSLFRQRALRRRSPELLVDFPAPATRPGPSAWHGTAAQVYANWLSYLESRRLEKRGRSGLLAVAESSDA